MVVFKTQVQLAKMGNMSGKQEAASESRYEFVMKIVPPVDRALIRWLARDVERVHGFVPRRCSAVKPPDHYIEYMQLNGWLDLSLDDPDLAHLFLNQK